jgi:nucleotide-binding universal stress UspA family protein
MIDHILVPLDGSRLAECVLPHGVALARTFQSRLTVAHALAAGQARSVDPLGWQMRKKESESYLGEVVERLSGLGLHVGKVLLEGSPAKRVIEFARESGVDLIVVSSHGRSGLSEWNISSVVQKIILRTVVPTLIVRAYRNPEREIAGMRYQKILIPLDGSQRAEYALPLAAKIASDQGGRLLLAHVVPRPEVPRREPLTAEEQKLCERLSKINRDYGEAYLRDLQGRLPVDVQLHLLIGEDPAATLHDLVAKEDVDLVVLSAHGYTGRTNWPYGSIALNFITYGATPLLIVQDLTAEEMGPTPAERAASEEKGH